MRYLLVCLFLYAFSFATTTSNEGINWSIPPGPGAISNISEPISNQIITPLMSNVVIFKFRILNTIGDNWAPVAPDNIGRPSLSSILYSFNGTAVDSDFLRVRLWFNTNGIDSQYTNNEFNTSYDRFTNGRKFDSNFSPAVVQGKKAIFGGFGAAGMHLFNAWMTNYYIYLTADFSSNVIDHGTVKVTIPFINMFWWMNNGTFSYEQNMVELSNINDMYTYADIRIEVTATKLVIENVPALIGSGQLFAVTVKAVDDYGNVDKDFTNDVYLIANGDPTATLPYSITNKYRMTTNDAGVKTIVGVAFNGGAAPSLTVSDGEGFGVGLVDGTSAPVTVVATIDKFILTEGTNSLPAKVTNVAGRSLGHLGLTNFMVTAFNYLEQVASNYNGSIYFESSARGWADSFPYSATNRYTFVTNTDLGVKNFNPSNFVLTKRGLQNLKVTDDAHKGEWLDIMVLPGEYSTLAISSPSEVLSGVAIPISIQGLDAYSNEVDVLSSNFTTRTIMLTLANTTGASGSNNTYPASIVISNTVFTLSGSNAVIIRDAGDYRITFTDASNAGISASKIIRKISR